MEIFISVQICLFKQVYVKPLMLEMKTDTAKIKFKEKVFMLNVFVKMLRG